MSVQQCCDFSHPSRRGSPTLRICHSPSPSRTDNYEARSQTTGSQTVTNLTLLAFCSDDRCCAFVYCSDARGCGNSSIALAYTAPTSGVCDQINRGPLSADAGNFFAGSLACRKTNGFTQSFILSNPNQQLM